MTENIIGERREVKEEERDEWKEILVRQKERYSIEIAAKR